MLNRWFGVLVLWVVLIAGVQVTPAIAGESACGGKSVRLAKGELESSKKAGQSDGTDPKPVAASSAHKGEK